MRGTSAEETAQAGTPTDIPHPGTTTKGLTEFPSVAIAYFQSYDGDEIDSTAQADDTKHHWMKVEGIDGTYVRKTYNIKWTDVPGPNQWKWCRCRDDHNVAHKYFRRLCEMKNVHLIEVA